MRSPVEHLTGREFRRGGDGDLHGLSLTLFGQMNRDNVTITSLLVIHQLHVLIEVNRNVLKLPRGGRVAVKGTAPATCLDF
jgi:hypothetical protein